MTAFDFTVIGVIVLSGVFAFSRGFVREALSIAAWILAAVAAYYAFPYVLPFFERFLPKGMIAGFATASAVFVIALIVLHMIAKAVAARVKHGPLSTVDRTLGLLFGLARGFILVCVGYIALAWFMPAGENRPRWFAESRTLPYLAAGAETLEHYFSRSTRAVAPGRSASAVEKEAERAISAFTNPASSSAASANNPPVYTPSEQRDLNRLIQQQNAPQAGTGE